MLSDSDSSDSDNGIRFKIDSIRTKETGSSHLPNKDRDRDSWRGGQRSNDRPAYNDRRSRRSESRERRRGRDRSKSRDRPKEKNHSRSRDRQIEKNRSKSRERIRDAREDTKKWNRSRSRDRERLNESRGYLENRKKSHRSRSRDRQGETQNRGSRSRNSSRNRDVRKRSNSNEIERSFQDSRNKAREEDREKNSNTNTKRTDNLETEIRKIKKSPAEDISSSTRIEDKTRTSARSSPTDLDKNRISSKRITAEEEKPISREERSKKVGNDVPPLDDRHKLKKSKHKKHRKSKYEDREEPTTSSRSSSATTDRNETVSKDSIAAIAHREDIFDAGMCGPSLPPHMVKAVPGTDDERVCVQSETDSHKSSSRSQERRRVVGPTLPSHIDLEAAASYQPPEGAMSDISESGDDDEEYDLVGPLPPGLSKSDAHLELERRALELKLAKLNESEQGEGDEPARDEWMMALPEVRKVTNMGLVARQFRTKDRPEIGDRTGWTDTPGDREKKAQRKGPTTEELMAEQQREAEAVFRAKRDAEQEKAATKHKKKHKRDHSLLDLHQKKLKKKKDKEREKEKESGKLVRRPFSREEDLKVNRFDEAQKKSVMKKAQLLDTRFGSGESKYL